MSRSEERRRNKAAGKKATVARPSQPATPRPHAKQKTLTIQQAINLGLEHHNAGRLPEAKRIYQQILQTNPDLPVVLHLLGVIAHQVGKNSIAIDLIAKALANNPNFAEDSVSRRRQHS